MVPRIFLQKTYYRCLLNTRRCFLILTVGNILLWMKRKKIVIFFVAFCSLGAMFLIYDGVEKSRFTEKDLNAEKAASATAKAMSDEIRKIISGIPLASDIVLSDDTEYKEECHYSRISTKNGSKSRFCEKKIIEIGRAHV